MSKIGFIQDLIRGIDKVLGAGGEEEKENGEIREKPETCPPF